MSLDFIRDELIVLLHLRADKVRFSFDMIICDDLACLSELDFRLLLEFCQNNNLWFEVDSYMFDKAGFILYVYQC